MTALPAIVSTGLECIVEIERISLKMLFCKFELEGGFSQAPL
jgi:hypothetical protein